ncbi:hypothetical protein ACN079_11010 [Pseudomonas sp. ABY48]|uniref:hypothetical protein n=1 Tax=Pseudomonas sp. ABY48 TaxID=3402865 RepID=UPI003B429243
MRDLTLAEIEMISGAVGPLGAVAGAAAAGAAYVGTQAGSGAPATWTGAGKAMVVGAGIGFFTPTTTAQAAGTAMLGFYGGLTTGYLSRGGIGTAGA